MNVLHDVTSYARPWKSRSVARKTNERKKYLNVPVLVAATTYGWFLAENFLNIRNTYFATTRRRANSFRINDQHRTFGGRLGLFISRKSDTHRQCMFGVSFGYSYT